VREYAGGASGSLISLEVVLAAPPLRRVETHKLAIHVREIMLQLPKSANI
jgi:hypothetical protein